MRETCTSGSVRGEGGNLLTYSARKGWVSINYVPGCTIPIMIRVLEARHPSPP